MGLDRWRRFSPKTRRFPSPSRTIASIPRSCKFPAGVKLQLLVKNLDGTPEEFESHTLHREKVVPGGGEITVFIGPLDPGTYDFFGDFNPATAQGRIIAK